MMDVSDYYKNTSIRKRIAEFLGVNRRGDVSTLFLTTCDVAQDIGYDFHCADDLNYFLERGFDISRSLWDEKFLLAHMDIEYVNFDFPAEPYLDPVRSFALQNQAVLDIEKLLLEHGIAPLHLLSGRGHHFVWSIDQESTAFGILAKIGRLPAHLKLRYATKNPPVNKSIDEGLAAAFAGLGLIMEYIAFSVKRDMDLISSIPVELSAVEVPPQVRGRELISLDTTEYGDLLHTRLIRVPYSLYLKPWFKCDMMNDQIRDKIPRMASIPLFEMGIQEGVEVMRDLEKAADLASRAPAWIPDQSTQMIKLINAYESSGVAVLHDWFYNKEHASPDLWCTVYDTFPLDLLPPCVRTIMIYPNDLLLKPAGIRQVVRSLLSLGWHPRHIAGLIRSKYERNHGWGREWYFYDAATRADYYTRSFTILVASGVDTLKDYTCQSIQSSGYCMGKHSSCSLEKFRASLLERVSHERLADRPFNRLLL
jgi:hypothetical protein